MGNLIKIKDMSAKYDVSARTMRYYEDIGLLESTRLDDYAYRLYDESAVQKLEQILILRKLNITIKDIQRIFNSTGSEIILEVLGKKVDDIDNEAALLHELKKLVLDFIHQIETLDFSNGSDVKKLYEKARDMEKQLENPTIRLMEVTAQMDKKIPGVMVVNIPRFRAVTSGLMTFDELFGGCFDEWLNKSRHLFKDVLFDCPDFLCEKNGKAYWLWAVKDDVTAADTAPYEIVDFEGGIYATSVSIDMDDESMDKVHSNVLSWLKGTNFAHDTSRDFMGHMIYPSNEIKLGLGYHQLQRYIPIKFDIENWQTVYSLSTDEYVQGQENGTKNGGFGSESKGIASTGNPEFTFNEGTILVEKRKNDWDGVYVKTDKMNLQPNNYCYIEVVGRVTGKLKSKGGIELTGIAGGYENVGYHPISDGADFKISHIFPIMKDKTIPHIRISSGHISRTVPFLIERIEVKVKPFSHAPNYTSPETFKYLVFDTETFERHCEKATITGVEGIETLLIESPDAPAGKFSPGKYLETHIPSSIRDIGDVCKHVKDLFENYIPEWLTYGAGYELTGEPPILQPSPNNENITTLIVRITPQEES